jgi:hypothetical protein
MSFFDWPTALILVSLVVLILLLWKEYKTLRLPDKAYLKLISEKDWKNRIILLHEVRRESNQNISVARNIWNLDKLVKEGFIEEKDDTTWLQGEHEVDTISYKITEKGLNHYKRSLP